MNENIQVFQKIQLRRPLRLYGQISHTDIYNSAVTALLLIPINSVNSTKASTSDLTRRSSSRLRPRGDRERCL